MVRGIYLSLHRKEAIIQLSNKIKAQKLFGSHSNNYINRVKNSSRHLTPVRNAIVLKYFHL